MCNNKSATELFERVKNIGFDTMEGIVKEINDLTVEWSFFWNEKEINGALLACECENEDDLEPCNVSENEEVEVFKEIGGGGRIQRP